MKRHKETLLVLYFVTEALICGSVNDEYKRYPNKRLMNNVIKTVVMSSKFDCVTLCSMTDSCLAVNVMGNYDITCELTTGLSNENEMEDDSLSELFVLDYNTCTEEPEFCLNNATCEQTWTSARCHCPDRYIGDRCDKCPVGFQGDGCTECIENHYGTNCDVTFGRYSNMACGGVGLHTMNHDNSGNYDNCKQWCVTRRDCGGFTVNGGKCYLRTCPSNYPTAGGYTMFQKN